MEDNGLIITVTCLDKSGEKRLSYTVTWDVLVQSRLTLRDMVNEHCGLNNFDMDTWSITSLGSVDLGGSD